MTRRRAYGYYIQNGCLTAVRRSATAAVRGARRRMAPRRELLLRRRRSARRARGRDDPLQAHVGHEVAVVLHVMSNVEVHNAQTSSRDPKELDRFGGFGVGQVGVGRLAVRERFVEGLDDLGFPL